MIQYKLSYSESYKHLNELCALGRRHTERGNTQNFTFKRVFYGHFYENKTYVIALDKKNQEPSFVAT
jgi:hypothetical protein